MTKRFSCDTLSGARWSVLVLGATVLGLSKWPSTSAAAVSVCERSFPVGLENLGNTCYLNAQLQCAYHIPLVRRIVLQHGREEAAANDDTDHTYAALRALRRVFQDLSAAAYDGGRPPAPRNMCQTLGIPVGEQQDSQEFWKLLLPALQVPILADLYTGVYQDYIVALDGSGRERRRDETFLDLSLSIGGGSSNTLSATTADVMESLRQQFGEPELLSHAAGNAWRPEAGADKVDAHKGYLLTAKGLPPILQLHLKRFHFDWATEQTTKLNDALSFPQMLDLRDLAGAANDLTTDMDETSDSTIEECLYELQAVVIHMGKYSSGHYYSYVRPDVRSDDWYRLNDAVVTKVQFEDVIRDAYGERQTPRVKQINEQSTTGSAKGKAFVGFFRNIFGFMSNQNNDGGYGYGGPESSAYVLQYIRRCDIAKLYDSDE